jgi:hypothetical protein
MRDQPLHHNPDPLRRRCLIRRPWLFESVWYPIRVEKASAVARALRLHPTAYPRARLAAMPEERPEQPVDVAEVVAGLEERVERERAAGAYADDLSSFELEVPPPEATDPRVRFKPELGFSSKPVVGRPITFVKRVLLRLQLYVFDDLARQTDEAIRHVEQRLEVEIAQRERLERELEARIESLEERAGPQPRER